LTIAGLHVLEHLSVDARGVVIALEQNGGIAPSSTALVTRAEP
jgi:hypothetical protein